MLTLDDLSLKDKRVLVRVDFNVPMHRGTVTDDTRIRACTPTIERLLQERAAVMLMSHLGRPRAGTFEPEFSLEPVARHLGKLLGVEVNFQRDWLGRVDVEAGNVVLLENVRFLEGETEDDDALARQMAALCDVYVNDAFATAHRAQASTHGVAKYAPAACAGPLLIAEVDALSRVLEDPRRPLLAIVGGAKVSTKLKVLENLASKVDRLILGGGILNTFLKAAGRPIGASLHEPDLVESAARLAAELSGRDAALPLPVDLRCGDRFAEDAAAVVRSSEAVADADLIMDIGPETERAYAEIIAGAGTILWNGPLGVFEFPAFSSGTRAVADAVAAGSAYSVAGGGDTLAAIAKFGVTERISYISTGGGAFLEFVEGTTLPAVAILEEAARAMHAAEREY